MGCLQDQEPECGEKQVGMTVGILGSTSVTHKQMHVLLTIALSYLF